MSATTTRPAAALDLDLVIGERPGATCPGCGRPIPPTRGPAVELETPGGRTLCYRCARTDAYGLYCVMALLNYVLNERRQGRPERARAVLLALGDGLDLLDEHEAEAAQTRRSP